MREDFLGQPAPFGFVKRFVEAQNAPATLETVTRHLEFIHSVDVLYKHFDTWSIRSLYRPHVKVFMASSFKIEGIVAVM